MIERVPPRRVHRLQHPPGRQLRVQRLRGDPADLRRGEGRAGDPAGRLRQQRRPPQLRRRAGHALPGLLPRLPVAGPALLPAAAGTGVPAVLPAGHHRLGCLDLFGRAGPQTGLLPQRGHLPGGQRPALRGLLRAPVLGDIGRDLLAAPARRRDLGQIHPDHLGRARPLARPAPTPPPTPRTARGAAPHAPPRPRSGSPDTAPGRPNATTARRCPAPRSAPADARAAADPRPGWCPPHTPPRPAPAPPC